MNAMLLCVLCVRVYSSCKKLPTHTFISAAFAPATLLCRGERDKEIARGAILMRNIYKAIVDYFFMANSIRHLEF